MRIGINASFARKPGSGIGQVTINFIKELAASSSIFIDSKNEEAEFIIYLEQDLFGDIVLPENFRKSVFLPFWKRDDLLRKVLWEKFYLPRKAKKDGCDIFLSLYQCPTIFPKEIRHTMLVHDIIPKLFPEYLNNLRKQKYWEWTERAIEKAQKILAVSSRTEKDLVQHLGIDAKKITVNYIDCDEIYGKPVSQARIQKILKKYHLKPGYIYTGGGLEGRKNTEGVVQAYKHLLESNRNHPFIEEIPQLVISGKLMPQLAPLITDVEKLVRELNISGHVEILDFVDQEDLPALYSQALFFIYPSRYEGFGIPVLEAMKVGCAVITSKISSLPEVGLDSVLYCYPDDVRDIAMVMKNALTNHDLRNTLKRRGQQRAKNFSWKKFTEKIANEIKENKIQ